MNLYALGLLLSLMPDHELRRFGELIAAAHRISLRADDGGLEFVAVAEAVANELRERSEEAVRQLHLA